MVEAEDHLAAYLPEQAEPVVLDLELSVDCIHS